MGQRENGRMKKLLAVLLVQVPLVCLMKDAGWSWWAMWLGVCANALGVLLIAMFVADDRAVHESSADDGGSVG